MVVRQLRAGLLAETFGVLQSCGKGLNECVAYWVGDQDSAVLDEVVHPLHDSSLGGYEVDSAWINDFFLELRRRGRQVSVQIHTHPGSAGHSQTDDRFSLVPIAGFLSLVIPNFAQEEITFEGSVLMELTGGERWRVVDPFSVFELQ